MWKLNNLLEILWVNFLVFGYKQCALWTGVTVMIKGGRNEWNISVWPMWLTKVVKIAFVVIRSNCDYHYIINCKPNDINSEMELENGILSIQSANLLSSTINRIMHFIKRDNIIISEAKECFQLFIFHSICFQNWKCRVSARLISMIRNFNAITLFFYFSSCRVEYFILSYIQIRCKLVDVLCLVIFSNC